MLSSDLFDKSNSNYITCANIKGKSETFNGFVIQSCQILRIF